MNIEEELRQKVAVAAYFGQEHTLEGIILEHGRRFRPVPLPDGVVMGEPRNCFSNSMGVVLAADDDENYRYCEGYAWRPGHSLILIHHGWVTVDGTDIAIDTTLPESAHYEYWGIDFQTEYAVTVMEKWGVTGRTLETFTREILLEGRAGG